MTSTQTRPPAPEPTAAPPRRRGWFAALLLRIHFYAGILVGPFILIAAVSGALYALTPQLEQVVYQRELHAPTSSTQLPLADQIEIADEHLTDDDVTLSAVRPAPQPGDTTRIMYAQEGLAASESRAVFIDPGTGEVRGDHVVYGTSGALPLRTWIDNLHRNLHLGDAGRLYSELAASWLGIVVLAGLGLWIVRRRRSRAKRDFVRPNGSYRGYRRIFSWHAATGIWLLVGALFLSATGITWSQFAGGNVTQLRAVFDWSTPSVDASLGGDAAPVDEHAEHRAAAAPATAVDPATFDEVLAVAQTENVNVGLVEIKPPAEAGSAWVVQEIQRSFPTEVDSVAIDGETLDVVDRVDFDDYPFAAKLARWGIDTHQGTMFGLPNQILLFLTAAGIAAMVVFGYLMWWKRRPTRGFGKAPAQGALLDAPVWGIAMVVIGGLAIAFWLPLVGVTLAAFAVVDALLSLRRSRARG